jgi:hypothetical protein
MGEGRVGLPRVGVRGTKVGWCKGTVLLRIGGGPGEGRRGEGGRLRLGVDMVVDVLCL